MRFKAAFKTVRRKNGSLTQEKTQVMKKHSREYAKIPIRTKRSYDARAFVKITMM